MKTRHVIAIGILTAIAVGLLAIGIKYTGQKPKVQTNAYSEFTDYQYNNNNPNWTITGKVDTIDNGLAQDYQESTRNRPLGEYRISKTGNEIYSYFKIEKIASEEFDNPYYITINKEKSKTFNIPNEKQVKNINITTDCYKAITYMNVEYWEYDFYMNFTFTDNTTYRNFVEIEYTFGEGVYYFEDYNNIPYDYIDVETTINTLKYAYQTGYSTGYQTKGSLEDGNFVSIQDTMFSVLTMPFTFIGQAFNVTLWEGTNYALNIGNFIKGLIAIASILFIIKMFTSGFSVIGNYVSGTGNNISQWRKNRSERKLNESKTRLNDRTDPNTKTKINKKE